MIKRLTIVLLMLCGIKGASAQSTNGLIVGTNYMMYKPGGVDTPFSEDVSYKSGLGLNVGYRFNWQLSSKWGVGTGLSLIKYNITGTYFEGTTYEQINDEWVFYASLPILFDYKMFRNASFVGGYQYSYLTVDDIHFVNQTDHALVFGASYKLAFCSFQLLYQQSLNTEKLEGTYGDVNDPKPYTRYSNKQNGFHLLVYFPLNKRKDKKD